MLSRRRLIYYTIVLTSVFWIIGTLSFLLLQSLEVNIEVKRRSVEYFPLQKPRWNFRLDNFIALPLRSNRITDQKPEIIEKSIITSKKETERRGSKKIVLVTANYEKYPPGVDHPNGPGEMGEAVTVEPELKEREDAGYELHAFNLEASNKISLHRTLGDHRVEE